MAFASVRRVVGLVVLAAVILPSTAHAQVPGRDTTRARRDSVRSPADTARPRVDTVRVPRPDSARARTDTVRRPPPVVVPVPAPPDSAARDSIRADSARRVAARTDSIRRARAADTIRAPLAHPEVPTVPAVGAVLRWDRPALFSTGALTLLDLLEHVPGITAFRSGWVLSPHTAAYAGDFGRLRVFYDGVELTELDPRMGGIPDLSRIPLWTLEEVVVEPTADEVRVHLRSWRVRSTTPVTRADVSTGDIDSNSYRGFFGRRFRGGAALQVAAQQFSTTDPRFGGDGNQTGMMGRLGWARRKLSVDAFATRVHVDRNAQLTITRTDSLPGLDAAETNGYVRVGYGDPDAGSWAQVLASVQHWGKKGAQSTTTGSVGRVTATDTTKKPSGDTSATVRQYILTGGLTRWGVRLSATGRLWSDSTRTSFVPAIRAAMERGWALGSVYVERGAADSASRADVTVRVQPLRFLAVRASAGRTGRRKLAEGGFAPPTTSLLGEVGVRLGRMWLSGGALTRDTALVPPPIVYDTATRPVIDRRTTTVLATLRGTLWKSFSLDFVGERNGNAGFYKPLYQARTELYVSTGLLRRFPSGNFHIRAGLTHEYRTQVRFPLSDGRTAESSQYRVWSSLLEIRILAATLSWQFRNFLGEPYAQVPGFQAVRRVNFYGVRWEFSN